MYLYTVKLNNVKIYATHGLYEKEKKNKQPFEVDLKATFSKSKGCDDDLGNSLDYQHIYDIVLDVFTSHTFNLIESLSEKIIEEIFSLGKSIERIEITIRKPEVLLGDNHNCIEVTTVRVNE